MDIDQRITAIAEDSKSGAAELLKAAVRLLSDICRARDIPDRDVAETVRRAARDIIAAGPAMAGFVSLAADVFKALERLPLGADVRAMALQSLLEFSLARDVAKARVAELGFKLLEPDTIVVTCSRSSVVLACLARTADAGLRLRVICPESRPMREGLTLANELTGLGHRAAVVSDGLAPFLVERAGVVMVGGDTVVRRGLVNKAGTYALALAAKHANVPMYGLCSTEKFLAPAHEHYFRNAPRDPGQLVPEPPPGVEAWNYYFDITPLELLTGVVTEDGVLSPDEVLQRLESIPVVEELTQAEAG